MNGALLRLYHRLPWPARFALASLRGWRLRGWRYGPETERLVQEALERERWPGERWRLWREGRLAALLHRAATQVPYYREQWASRRRRGDSSSWERLENWPVLEKEELRRLPGAFLAEDCDRSAMFQEHTSGTTGTPLTLWWSRSTVRAWYALFEARWRRWHGVSLRDRWAILGGQLVTGVGSTRPPFWVWNAPMSQLYMSSYHLAPGLIGHYLDALERYEVRYILGYPSALNALAQEALRQRRTIPMAVVLTNAEPLLAHQREAMRLAFRCAVRDTYGMAEIVAAGGECERQGMHLWPEVGIVEALDGDGGAAAGVGDLVCTGLINADMPLIRYRVGDRGALGLGGRTCECGRTLPIIESLAGRCDDMLRTRDGRLIGRLDPVFKAELPIREAQVIQETPDRLRVLYVPGEGCSERTERAVIDGLRARLGAVEVLLEKVAMVPREPNGKFRAVVSRLNGDQAHARP